MPLARLRITSCGQAENAEAPAFAEDGLRAGRQSVDN